MMEKDNSFARTSEDRLTLKAMQFLLACSVLSAAMPVSAVALYKFIDLIPKFYFVVFLTVFVMGFTACLVLSLISAWNGNFSQKTRASLLNAAYIVFLSTIGLFAAAMLTAMIIFLILM